MNIKQQLKQIITPLLLAVTVMTSGIVIFPSVVQAAGWLEHANQTITLGTTVSGSIKSGDYYGQTERNNNAYWHVYKVTMPRTGLLNIYLESLSRSYLNYAGDNGFIITSMADPDKIVWRSRYGENEIERHYSASRAMYYGSTEIALGQGEYYFAVRQRYTVDEPYYLTLSYKEPVINITSITIKPSSLMLKTGEQQTLIPTVLPNNATDKNITWQSADSSVATVNSGRVEAVSVGNTSIIASSSDGEITAVCPVTVICPHAYRTTVTPATKTSNGYLVEKCGKCGNIRKEQTIYAIGNVTLSKKTAAYNGKVQIPSVIVQNAGGRVLTANTDYTLSYTGNMRTVGKHSIRIKFQGNYKGTISKTFTIKPKSTTITKASPRKKGFTVKWKKQTAQTTGYELAYSVNRKFTKKNTKIISIKNKTGKKAISKLKSGKKYYVRIRTYKNVKVNGRTARFYSGWSKTKTVVTKK